MPRRPFHMLERVDNSWSSSGEEKAEESRAEQVPQGMNSEGKQLQEERTQREGEKVSTVVVRVSTL